MAVQRITNFQGINLYVNPSDLQPGELIRAVNVENYPYGAIRKRSGYDTYLSTGNGSAVENMFSWTKDDGTTTYLYKAQGGLLYYYDINGVAGDWTIAGNGTITNEAGFGAAVLNNTLVGGDGAGSTRHTTNGTAFTDTTLAPPARYFAEFQSRIYAAGTASDLFFSTTDDGTNWATSGTSDSSSIPIPGEGKLGAAFKAGDRLIVTKNSGIMNTWDGYARQDLATRQGPSSFNSIGELEDFRMYLNRGGIRGFGGGKPQLLSNQIQGLIFNENGNGITGANFDSAAGIAYKTDYLVSVGSTTDDLTNQTLTNAVIKYDIQKNIFLTWDMANKPTAWLRFIDENRNDQLLFGDGTGQVYQKSSSTTDNGTAIYSAIEGFLDQEQPEKDKEYTWVHAQMNPGNQAKLQVAVTSSFHTDAKRWFDVGDCSRGAVSFRLPPNMRGRYLFYRVVDNSTTSRWILYMLAVEYDVIQ